MRRRNGNLQKQYIIVPEENYGWLYQFRELMYDMDYTMSINVNTGFFIEDDVLDNLDLRYERQRRN